MTQKKRVCFAYGHCAACHLCHEGLEKYLRTVKGDVFGVLSRPDNSISLKQ